MGPVAGHTRPCLPLGIPRLLFAEERVAGACPAMSYEGMEVSDGNEAGLAWEKMVRAEAGSEERKKLRSDLLAYCKQDTLAMVRLLEVLRAA